MIETSIKREKLVVRGKRVVILKILRVLPNQALPKFLTDNQFSPSGEKHQ